MVVISDSRQGNGIGRGKAEGRKGNMEAAVMDTAGSWGVKRLQKYSGTSWWVREVTVLDS